jgi:hypothetical protein
MNTLGRSLLIAMAIAAANGCSTVYMATGDKGADVTAVVPGASAQSVRDALGEPIREWRNERDVVFRLYEFDGGRAGHPGYALVSGLISVASLGLWEILMTKVIENEKRTGIGRTRIRLVVSYDREASVLGVFDEFDDLPADGRNLPKS